MSRKQKKYEMPRTLHGEVIDGVVRNAYVIAFEALLVKITANICVKNTRSGEDCPF
jgi:hypothetical protein